MIRTHHKRIALFLSFVMVALLLCQGMAQAAQLGEMMSRHAAAEAVTCHDMAMKMPAAAHGTLCPADCQHIDKALDSSSLSANLGNLHLLATAFWLPAYSPVEAIQIVSLAPSSHSHDPPLLVRFQHFRI